MKYLIISMILSLFVYAGEMDRIESIVKDIEVLRADYNRCKQELAIKDGADGVVPKIDFKSNKTAESKEKDLIIKKYKKLLDSEKLRNTILIAKHDILGKKQKLDVNNIQNNEKSNKEYLKILKIKEKENIYLKNRLDIQNEELKNKDKIINNLKNQINLKDKTPKNGQKFPKLMMKDSKKEKKIIKEVAVNLKASTFKLVKDSDIYNSVNGKVIYQWKAKTAFTSNKMTQNWMKITGYFIDKKWKKAPEKLWIKKINIVKR